VKDPQLEGKVALVTGAGRGLGESIAQALCRSGATVVVADIDEQRAKQVVGELETSGGRATTAVVDLRDERQIVEVVGAAHAEHGRIDVLVNNAGIDRTVPIEELSIGDWDRILGVNLRAPFVMSKEVLPIMGAQRSGHIVSITSTAAKRAWANAAAYHASKWGLLGFSHALHVEAREKNVKVTAVVAGGMRTPFLLDRFPDLDPAVLQDSANVAETVRFVLTQPENTVIPEVMVVPMRETSWP
jgi:NAD(P)-dependent dehydrogenase (short-subunit alcohol dehydrogenase family)